MQTGCSIEIDCSQLDGPFMFGSAVEYFSQTSSTWIPAVVQNFNPRSGTYQLDVHSAAPECRVRAVLSNLKIPKRQHLDGTEVEYYSVTRGGWVPAVVQGFNEHSGTYTLDIQPAALPCTIRVPAAGAVTREHSDCNRISHSRRYAEQRAGIDNEVQEEAWVVKARQMVDEKSVRGGSCCLSSIPGITLEQMLRLSDQDIWRCAWKFAQRQHSAAGMDSDPTHDQQVWGVAKHAWRTWKSMRDSLLRHCGVERSATPCVEESPGLSWPSQTLVARVSPSSEVWGGGKSGPRRGLCGSCQSSCHPDDLLSPACGHLFCSRCLRHHILQVDFIRQGVKCLCCTTTLTPSLVKRAIGNEAYAAQQAQMEREDAELAHSVAMGAKLPCPRCGMDEHEGVTCEKFQEWQRDNSRADRRFNELMAQERWRRCPSCGMASERAGGCNFMQCNSAKCQKRTYWCYICGRQLAREDHYSHYPRSPYEDVCYTPLDQHVPLSGVRAPGPNAESRMERGQKVSEPWPHDAAAQPAEAQPATGQEEDCVFQ